MKKIAVVPAPGLGDVLILHIVSFHLQKAGFNVTTITPHNFGKWLSHFQFANAIQEPFDAIFLQHDNKPLSFQLRKTHPKVYTFFGAYNQKKHGPFHPKQDFVCDLQKTMVDNIIECLFSLFQIEASGENGMIPPPNTSYRKYPKRIAIHTTSNDPFRNWPMKKFEKVAKFLEGQGLQPTYLPLFPSLEELTTFIYESGFFLGNDSGPGHLASYLQIPHLIIGKEEKHLRHWRPGWYPGIVLTPSSKIPNFRPFRLRERQWKRFITPQNVIKHLKNSVLNK